LFTAWGEERDGKIYGVCKDGRNGGEEEARR
jgi:hypothetical protein